VLRDHPELKELTASPPGSSDRAADHFARRFSCECGHWGDGGQWRNPVVVLFESRVDYAKTVL
jgi:hypothetical protein